MSDDNNTEMLQPEVYKGYKLFNLPWKIFAILAIIVLAATYIGVLPTGMAGCFAFMIVVGTILNEIGEKTPIINSYLGGGAALVSGSGIPGGNYGGGGAGGSGTDGGAGAGGVVIVEY